MSDKISVSEPRDLNQTTASFLGCRRVRLTVHLCTSLRCCVPVWLFRNKPCYPRHGWALLVSNILQVLSHIDSGRIKLILIYSSRGTLTPYFVRLLEQNVLQYMLPKQQKCIAYISSDWWPDTKIQQSGDLCVLVFVDGGLSLFIYLFIYLRIKLRRYIFKWSYSHIVYPFTFYWCGLLKVLNI